MGEPIRARPWDRVEETPRGTIIVTGPLGGKTVYPSGTPKIDIYSHDGEGRSSGSGEYKKDRGGGNSESGEGSNDSEGSAGKSSEGGE